MNHHLVRRLTRAHLALITSATGAKQGPSELRAAEALARPALERLGAWLTDAHPWGLETVQRHRVELEQERDQMSAAARVLGRRLWWGALERARDDPEVRALINGCACPIGLPFARAVHQLEIEKMAGAHDAFALLEGTQKLIAAITAAVGMAGTAAEARRYEYADVDVGHFGTFQTQFEAFAGEAEGYAAILA